MTRVDTHVANRFVDENAFLKMERQTSLPGFEAIRDLLSQPLTTESGQPEVLEIRTGQPDHLHVRASGRDREPGGVLRYGAPLGTTRSRR
jgi:hypothetical protein